MGNCSSLEKVTKQQHLDSPSEKETWLPYLNLTASKKQKAGKPHQEVNLEACRREHDGWTHTNPCWESDKELAIERPHRKTHFLLRFVRNGLVDFRAWAEGIFTRGWVFPMNVYKWLQGNNHPKQDFQSAQTQADTPSPGWPRLLPLLPIPLATNWECLPSLLYLAYMAADYDCLL